MSQIDHLIFFPFVTTFFIFSILFYSFIYCFFLPYVYILCTIKLYIFIYNLIKLYHCFILLLIYIYYKSQILLNNI